MEIIVNVILFFVGLTLGNWLAIGRDKRKEFNEVADEVHFALKNQKDNIENNRAVKRGPEEKDLEKLKRRISFFKRKSFEEALRKYREATSSENWKQGGTGQPFYKNSQVVINSINDIIQFTNRK